MRPRTWQEPLTQRNDPGSDPYRPPEVGERTTPGISPLRYVVNMGCGLGAMMILVPSTGMALYSMSSDKLPGILVAVLLMLGMGHSIWWARRARHRKRMDGS